MQERREGIARRRPTAEHKIASSSSDGSSGDGSGGSGGGVSVTERLQELRELLDRYTRSSMNSLDRLQLLHGPMPDPSGDASAFLWWLARALPQPRSLHLHWALLRATSLDERIELSRALLHDALTSAHVERRRQSAVIALLLLVPAVLYSLRNLGIDVVAIIRDWAHQL
jgi:hypothetical protein